MQLANEKFEVELEKHMMHDFFVKIFWKYSRSMERPRLIPKEVYILILGPKSKASYSQILLSHFMQTAWRSLKTEQVYQGSTSLLVNTLGRVFNTYVI